MRLINPSFQILEQQSGLEGIDKIIEIAGRLSHKSENNITEDSAKKFVDKMINLGHLAVLEHGTVYLYIPREEAYNASGESWVYPKYCENPYSRVGYHAGNYYITTNYRVLVENGWQEDLKYLCEPIEWHVKRVAVKFICDRGVLAEFTRHRVFSFMAESTRYCNYSKDKFNNEITFIKPCWLNIPEGNYSYWDGEWVDVEKMKIQLSKENNTANSFLWALDDAERAYKILLNKGWTAQEARAVLPNATKTELIMTGFVSDWEHFFLLRDDIAAHPQARELAHPLHELFIQRGLIK